MTRRTLDDVVPGIEALVRENASAKAQRLEATTVLGDAVYWLGIGERDVPPAILAEVLDGLAQGLRSEQEAEKKAARKKGRR